MIKLPIPLRQVLESGDCVLFVGAGIGHHMRRPDNSPAPDGKALAQELNKHFDLKLETDDLAKVSKVVELRHSRQELDNFVKKALADLQPDEIVQWLTTFRWRAIYTTNYDRGIERAYELNSDAPQQAVSISATADMEYTDPRIEVPIYHLHGTPYGPSTSPIVITQTDYASYQMQRRMLWNRLRNECATSVFLYIGYSGRDPNWQLVIDEVRREFFPSEVPRSYRLDPHADPVDIEIFDSQHLETLAANLSEFKAAVDDAIGGFRPSFDLVARYKDKVPPYLEEAFRANPAMVLRLLNSWELVNAADFASPPNIKAFLNGSRPNWALIEQGRKFTRDIDESVWDRTVEFATAPSAKSTALALVAPAGYGITTCLMTLATRIMRAKVGPVFMLKEGSQILEGDVAFAAALFPDVASFFLVDQAREHAHTLAIALHQQRQTKLNCLFVIGERKNEWHMAGAKLKAEEFEIEPLSDPEINELLDFLSAENALGEMEDLDRDFQFKIVKDKHEKELLVAMKEATAGEGIGFDAIIDSEYRGIFAGDEPTSLFARELYLLVCCFYQFGVLVRDRLLSEILNQPLERLWESTGAALEGLVDFKESDAARGEFAVRARHRTIAEIVWKKCGTQERKEHLLQTAMDRLNLSYNLDKTVFEKFVRSDEVSDTFRKLEGKSRFFDSAVKRAPNDPYVLQHYARMLLRSGQPRLALTQVDSALQKDRMKRARVIRHTKGTILAQLAMDEENDDIARNWLAQGEREFQACIDSAERDEYGYSGLANLYIVWAKRSDSDDELMEYLYKAEGIISKGLGKVRIRESLLISSAEIEKVLGNDPKRIAKLLQAVASNTSSPVARYLLARAFRHDGKPQKAIQFLDPVIRSDFSAVRSYIEYVKSMIMLGEPYAKCIGTLAQCKLDGMNNPVFVGLYGGLLYMEGKHDEAKAIWEEARERGFTYEERYRVRFRPRDPHDPNKPLRLEGTISRLMPGYVFIESTKTPAFISSRTMIEGKTLHKGTKVTFEPTFSAKGSYADNLQLD